jgi:hypothetical protein
VQQTNTGNHTGPIGNPVENLNIGRKEQNGFYFNGIIDEGRVISATRSADWLLTEYRNQNSPSTFYTKSIEYSANNLCWTLPVELLDFTAVPINGSNVLINWTTASETNNDFFTIQRSFNAIDWEELAVLNGSGSTSKEVYYSFVDKQVKPTIVYYRLQQTDFDGSTQTHQVVSVDLKIADNQPVFYPNPAQNEVTYYASKSDIIKLYDLTGRLVKLIQYEGNSELKIDISALKAGTYFLQSSFGSEKLIKL